MFFNSDHVDPSSVPNNSECVNVLATYRHRRALQKICHPKGSLVLPVQKIHVAPPSVVW
jgi:hypothetical protein